MIFSTSLRLFSLAGLLLLAPTVVRAQGGHGGGGMGGGGIRPGGMGGGMDSPRGSIGLPSGGRNPETNLPRGGQPGSSGGSPNGSMRGSLQLGPPGRWWDDKKYARTLGLNGDQQKRMDAVFGQNRDVLVSRFEILQRAESRLDSLTHTGKPSEAALFAEIDHVAQARAELEKANTHMLLQLRDEMTADQIGKLADNR